MVNGFIIFKAFENPACLLGFAAYCKRQSLKKFIKSCLIGTKPNPDDESETINYTWIFVTKHVSGF